MIYDYKSEELIQEVYIQCICPLCDDIINEYSTLRRYENLSIYAPSYTAREILGRLLDEIEDLWVDADSENELLYKDNNEVLITIAYDGMVFVEEAKVNGVIKSNEDCSLTYFYDGLGQKDLDILACRRDYASCTWRGWSQDRAGRHPDAFRRFHRRQDG